MQGVIEGRVVHFVLPDGSHRPALIVNAWKGGGEAGSVNLLVFLDGTNDAFMHDRPPVPPIGATRYADPTTEECLQGTMWRTSINHSLEPLEGTWHWPEHA